MTPSQAAEIIGCSPAHVRLLIRTEKIRAKRKRLAYGYRYDIPHSEAIRVRDLEPSRGRPRGTTGAT